MYVVTRNEHLLSALRSTEIILHILRAPPCLTLSSCWRTERSTQERLLSAQGSTENVPRQCEGPLCAAYVKQVLPGVFKALGQHNEEKDRAGCPTVSCNFNLERGAGAHTSSFRLCCGRLPT